jgi:hypothetical protein
MKHYSIIFISIVVLLASGCQKKDETPVQPDKVSFDVLSPHASQAFKKGDTVFIKADISYVSQLHGYSVSITDESTGAVVYSNEDHAHGDHFSIDEYWVDSLGNNNKALKLDIIAVIDHENNTAQKEVELKHQP